MSCAGKGLWPYGRHLSQRIVLTGRYIPLDASTPERRAKVYGQQAWSCVTSSMLPGRLLDAVILQNMSSNGALPRRNCWTYERALNYKPGCVCSA